MNLEAFKDAVKTLTEIKDNERNSRSQRIYALTELYFMFRGDVHAQATYVREIQDLTR